MSIKTTGQLQGKDLKTVPTVAGFVKNTAAGDFLFGQTGSAWTFLETKTLTSAATSIAFTGLDGNTDRAYRLVWENPFDVGTPAITDGRIYFHRNGVPTSNTVSVITNVDGDLSALSVSNDPSNLVISNMIVPAGAFPFVNSGIWDYTFRNVFGSSGAASGKTYNAREVNSYPGISRIDGRWLNGREGSGGALTSFSVVAAQTDMLRPGSVWSLYKIDSTV